MPKKKCKVPRSLRGYRKWSLEITDWISEFELPVIMISSTYIRMYVMNFGVACTKRDVSHLAGLKPKEIRLDASLENQALGACLSP